MMAGCAKPLTSHDATLRVLCQEQRGDIDHAKSKAKEAFLLTDKDCLALASAVGSSTFVGHGTTVLFLLMGVVAPTSFAKWGGPEGLESEISKRKAAAVIR
jgi:hypothetical protein